MSKTFLVENGKGEQHIVAGDPFPSWMLRLWIFWMQLHGWRARNLVIIRGKRDD